MVFRATTNNTGENGNKTQNTLPFALKSKVVEVCLVGAGERARTQHTSHAVKTYILTQKTPRIRRFVLFLILVGVVIHP